MKALDLMHILAEQYWITVKGTIFSKTVCNWINSESFDCLNKWISYISEKLVIFIMILNKASKDNMIFDHDEQKISSPCTVRHGFCKHSYNEFMLTAKSVTFLPSLKTYFQLNWYDELIY